MRYAIPRQTDDRLNSTNGFTIGKRYEILTENEFGSATVINDNGHPRVIGTDQGSNAHLQRTTRLGNVYCAGYFEIVSGSKFEDNSWNTTDLTLNVMDRVARLTKLDILDDKVADELYWICCGLEDWPEDQGFGSSDSYGYYREAMRTFHIPEENQA
jgi:hypothetical protein